MNRGTTGRALLAGITATGVLLLAAAPGSGQRAPGVRTAKLSEIKGKYAALFRIRVAATDTPPASVRVGGSVRAVPLTAWRRASGPQPLSKGGVTGVWLGAKGSNLCWAIRSTEGKPYSGCATLSIRTPAEPFPPITVGLPIDTVPDATAIGGQRSRTRVVVIVPNGPTALKIAERGGATRRTTAIARNVATARVLSPYCLRYRVGTVDQAVGRDCDLVPAAR